MTSRGLLGLGVDLAFGGSVAAGLGPGIVTAVEVMGDMSIAITNPSSQSVPMQTNGSTIRIATSGSASHTGLDLTKITLTVTDLGFDASGNEISRTRTVGINGKLYGPYNEANVYQPNLGEFYLKLSNRLYKQDAKWFSTVTAVNFASGWLTGQPAGQVLTASVTRSDSLAYPTPAVGAHIPFFQRVASGGTLLCEFTAVTRYPKDGSMAACFEAWAVDSGANAGTVARTSTFARSPNTPNDATLVGKPAPTYQVNVDPSGLTAGRCVVRWCMKPWIGPPVFGVTTTYAGTSIPGYGLTLQSAGGGANGIPAEFPFCYDTNGSYAPLYGLVIYDPAQTPSGFTRLIASSQNVATIDVSGLCATKAGAIASGVYYADYATLLTAVRRVNKNAGPFTILSDNGLSTKSYSRTTTHDDVAGAVGVCRSVSGSAIGAATGCYSNRVSTNSQASYPPGLTMPEIQSETNLPTDDVRWRGQDSTGGTTASNQICSRIRLRGITLDSSGIAVSGAQCAVFDGGGNGIQTGTLTEAQAIYTDYIDCRKISTNSVSTAFWVHYENGFVWDTRVDHKNPQKSSEINQASTALSGLVSSIGSNYHCDTDIGGVALTGELSVTLPPCIMGAIVKNISLNVTNAAGSVKGPPKGAVLFNVHRWCSIAGNTGNTQIGVSAPITALGMANVLVQNDTTTTATAISVALSADSTYSALTDVTIHGLSVALPNIATSAGAGGANDVTGRINIAYNDGAPWPTPKTISIFSSFARNFNTKGDNNLTSTDKASNYATWGSTTAYWQGAVVKDGAGQGYQAKTDIAASSGILLTDTTHWLATGTDTTAYGLQPTRQGNGNFRDSVDCDSNVWVSTAANGDPSSTSWYGRAIGPNSHVDAVLTNVFNSLGTGDFTPKPGGELVNRIPAGHAHSPIDLNGVTLLNDGTDAAGALQIPH